MDRKQDTITDLDEIRDGASAGATAIQSPSTSGTTGQVLKLDSEGNPIWANEQSGGAVIDDSTTAADKTWSSQKVSTELSNKQGTLTFDTAPTANSHNPVISGGIKTALDRKQDTITDLDDIKEGAALGATSIQPSDVMQGATAGAAGSVGLVPAPAAGDDTKILQGNGTWTDKPTNGKSAYDLYCDQEVTAGRTPLSPSDWLASLKATIGSYKFVSNVAAVETAFGNGGIGTYYTSDIDGVSPSPDTLSVILLMNTANANPSKTYMIATEEDGQGGYQFIYINNLDSAFTTNVMTADNQGKEITASIDFLNYNKLPLSVGRNLYDMSKRIDNKKLDTNGTLLNVNGFCTSPYIPVSANTNYYLNVSDNRLYVCYYNKYMECIGYVLANTKKLTTPNNCAYLRFSNVMSSDNYGTTQLELGSAATGYNAYNPAYGYINPVKESVDAKVDTSCGTNLFNKDTIELGKFIVSTGVAQGGPVAVSYNVSSYIPVVENQTYYISANGDTPVVNVGASSAICFAWYSSENQGDCISYLSASGVKEVTAPPTAKYLRISFLNTKTNIMVEKGTSRGRNYEEYSPVGAYIPILRDKQVQTRHLSDELVDKIYSSSSFGRMHGSDTLAVDEYLELDDCNVKKNTLLVARIIGDIQKVTIGVGRGGDSLNPAWVVLEPTKFTAYKDNNITYIEYNHGLTLTQDTTIEIDHARNGATETITVKISTGLGDIFEQVLGSTLAGWGTGRPYILNQNDSGSITVDLSYFPRDISGRIWLFGDSYLNLTSNARWPYYLVQQNMDKWLINGYPGQNALNAYDDLVSLLSLGAVPTYVVWTLGLNGHSDTGSSGNWTIAQTQKTVIDNVLTLCKQYGVTPILTAVPTALDNGGTIRQRTGFDEYVRGLGVRYIDFAEAVGAQEDGSWNAGLKEAAGVHPTIAGAKVLAARALLDFPEFSIVLQ